MLIQLTEEQKMLRDMAREFTKNEIEPRDRWMDDNGFDWDLYRKIAAAGFMGANIPEQYGGGGGGMGGAPDGMGMAVDGAASADSAAVSVG